MITDRIDAITKISAKYLGTIIPAPKSVKIEITATCNDSYNCDMDHTDAPYIKWLLGTHCVKSTDGKDCWLWTKSYRGNGYAQLTLEGRRQVQGNRAAWVAYVGPIPKGMYVCHKCDQPACCNPTHLFLGTAKDNTQDCVAKGRLRPGRVGGRKKITPDDVFAIRSLRGSGMLQREIAAKFGISQVRVSQLLLKSEQ